MSMRFGDFIDGLTTLPDTHSIWQHVSDFAQNTGYSGCSLVLARKRNKAIESPRIKSTFSSEFQSTYRDKGLGKIDPFLLFGCNSLAARKIVTRDLSSFPGATPAHKVFLEHAAENGAVNNLGVPVRLSGRGVYGGWIFSNSETDGQFEKLHKAHSTQIHLAGVLAYERMVAHDPGPDIEGQHRLPSNRERECLLWLCAGLRVSKIAARLDLSESAINLYLTNARKKLGAKTREQAVARAIFSGEINL